MKDHFNSVKSVYDSQKNPGLMNINYPKMKANQAPGTDSQAKTPEKDDWFDASLKPADLLADDAKAIEGMDFSMAMESVDFIRGMAKTPEGRSSMSQAHGPVDPRKIMQLFDIS